MICGKAEGKSGPLLNVFNDGKNLSYFCLKCSTGGECDFSKVKLGLLSEFKIVFGLKASDFDNLDKSNLGFGVW